jgi:formylmethanofuran dehydrogenase subunit C
MEQQPARTRLRRASHLQRSSRFRQRQPITGGHDDRDRTSFIRVTDFAALWRKRVQGVKIPADAYDAVTAELQNSRIRSVDVERCCRDLVQFQDDPQFPAKAGVMISALINASEDNEFHIKTGVFKEPLVGLGYRNRKNIFADGDVGGDFAAMMESGSAYTEGSVQGMLARELLGGVVRVEKNVYGKVAPWMKQGKVIVRGSVGSPMIMIAQVEGGHHLIAGDLQMTTGHSMAGGEIEVGGFAGPFTGFGQKGGVIRVGYAGSLVGPRRTGGEIIVEKECEGIAEQQGGGRIMVGERQVYPERARPDKEKLKELLQAWRDFVFDSSDIEGTYNRMFEAAMVLQHGSAEVEAFSRGMHRLEKRPQFLTRAGIFLSALINSGREIFYRVDLTRMGAANKLGYRNCKKVRAVGNVGAHAGVESDPTGVLMVDGNAGYGAGAWSSGTLVIRDNAGDMLGLGAQAGQVEAFGSAGKYTGHLLNGGHVYVQNEIAGKGHVINGTIKQSADLIIEV